MPIVTCSHAQDVGSEKQPHRDIAFGAGRNASVGCRSGRRACSHGSSTRFIQIGLIIFTSLEELRQAVAEFHRWYDHQRYPEALGNLRLILPP